MPYDIERFGEGLALLARPNMLCGMFTESRINPVWGFGEWGQWFGCGGMLDV